jgi:tetratricopeptide (TPR) repeat protein
MDMSDYKEVMRQFYCSIADFISDKPEIFEELTREEQFFKGLGINETERRNLVFDWYIFDYKSEVLSRTLLRYFLEKTALDKDLKAVYEKFKEGIFSIFEILALKTGKEMIARDMATGKEYNIKDASLTQQISKGQCGFLRVLPFKDYHILTGTGYFFPGDANRFIKAFFLDFEKRKKPFNLTPLAIYEIFFAQKKPEKLPVIERFTLFCKENGLKEDYINDIIERIKKEARDKGDFHAIQKELFAKMIPRQDLNIEEMARAFMDVWNSFISEETGYAEKGPLEIALINASMNYVQSKINPKKYKYDKNASEKADKLLDEWLKTPRQELDGKSPEQAILGERQKLGNSERSVKFKIGINSIMPGEEIFKNAEQAFNAGRELLSKNMPEEAIEVYKEYISYNPKNHVAWLNMGIAYILLIDKINAEKCFRKSLEIKPDYESAKRNMKILKDASQKDLERMAKEFRVVMINKGKEMKMP